jgi:hypothetical protein
MEDFNECISLIEGSQKFAKGLPIIIGKDSIVLDYYVLTGIIESLHDGETLETGTIVFGS